LSLAASGPGPTDAPGVDRCGPSSCTRSWWPSAVWPTPVPGPR